MRLFLAPKRHIFVADQMPKGAKCDFDTAQIQDDETCGWKIPQHHANHISEHFQYDFNKKQNRGIIID